MALAFGESGCDCDKTIALFDGVSVDVIQRSPEQSPSGRMEDIYGFSQVLSESIKRPIVDVLAKLLVVDGWSVPGDKIRSPSWMFDHSEFDTRNVAEGYGVCPERFTSEMLSGPKTV